jgi:hypothetical protein
MNILKSPIKVRNVDGTYNENGAITERCLIPFRINDRIMTKWFYVTALGDQNLILGLPWLEKHNPIIDWTEHSWGGQILPLAKSGENTLLNV